MVNNPIPKVPIKDIHKWPGAYLLLVMGSLLGALAAWVIASNTGQIGALRKTVEYYRLRDQQQEYRCDSAAAFWQNKYVKALEEGARDSRLRDSAARAILEQPAKRALEAINK